MKVKAGNGFMMTHRLEELRQLMKLKDIDAYIIPTEDFHLSEYTGEYFKGREFMSGFSGSAGTLIVTGGEAWLWTDGRYFTQAAKELSGSTIKLFRQGEPEVPDIMDYLSIKLDENSTVGFDGRVIAAHFGERLKQRLAGKKITLKYDIDLVDMIWTKRPPLPESKIYELDLFYTGLSGARKLSLLREKMDDYGATLHILTSLDDIAWLFNFRGSDVPYNPVALCYAIVKSNTACLFIDEKKLDKDMKQRLAVLGVIIEDYNAVYDYISKISRAETILLDRSRVNYLICNRIPKTVRVIDQINPTTEFKAIKNSIEIENIRKAHIKDGVAFTKFIYWLKSNIGKIEISEKTASDYLEYCRRKNDGFIELSFPTICAYKEHGAIIHYNVTEESDIPLDKEGLLLVDSGGHYFEGTTDITRTIVLGSVPELVKKQFTVVVKGMLNLSAARFLHGCTGLNLDILAREPLWERELDYKHGTGHGVGYLLNVHEGPNHIRWKSQPSQPSVVLEHGMITTNEPGIYIEGSHGIRIENELLCCKGEKNEFGQFMYFETLTFAPIDLDAIEIDDIDEMDKKRLNAYHELVYDKISPHLTNAEKSWLRMMTRPL